MKQGQKIIMCIECGKQVSGTTNAEVMRNEMDHFRINHPDLYQKMLTEIPLRQLFNWLLTSIRRKPARM